MNCVDWVHGSTLGGRCCSLNCIYVAQKKKKREHHVQKEDPTHVHVHFPVEHFLNGHVSRFLTLLFFLSYCFACLVVDSDLLLNQGREMDQKRHH